MALEGEALARKVTSSFNDVFFGTHAAPRVLASFHRLLGGPEHVELHKGKGLQVAETYIEGLTAEVRGQPPQQRRGARGAGSLPPTLPTASPLQPFPDPHDPVYGGWLAEVEAAADVIKNASRGQGAATARRYRGRARPAPHGTLTPRPWPPPPTPPGV